MISSLGPLVHCHSLPGLAASVIFLTTLLIALTYSIQQLAYICFTVAAMPYLFEVVTFYYVLSCKAIP